MKKKKDTIYILTIGHSTHSLKDFIDILKAYKIKNVVDIRTIPRSRHNPQFNTGTFSEGLNEKGICYVHLPGLGGLRKPSKDSLNNAWRNSSFRGFADYMQTKEFLNNLELVIELSKKGRVVLMCAETLPWRCHRSLIADALFVRKFKIEHILTRGKVYPHVFTPWARVNRVRVTYPLECK